VNPFEFLDEFFYTKTRELALSVSEDPSLRRFHSVPACDRRTDGQTDIPTMASTGLCIVSYADAL